MSIYNDLKVKYLLKNNIALIWSLKTSKLLKANDFKTIPLELLISIDSQKKSIKENTENFAKGNFTNNGLLWGARGNGKSSLIKSVFFEIYKTYSNLRLIQINKNSIVEIHRIYDVLKKNKKYRFIVFIDDLSFEIIDNDYKLIKSNLEGGLQNQPSNVVLYITSNRRHLMPKDLIDNERSSAIHTDESIEEKISLSDRFGIWIGFHNISQNDYKQIILSYCKYYKININEIDIKESIQWSLQRGNRNGRTAWQYILNLLFKKNLKIKF